MVAPLNDDNFGLNEVEVAVTNLVCDTVSKAVKVVMHSAQADLGFEQMQALVAVVAANASHQFLQQFRVSLAPKPTDPSVN